MSPAARVDAGLAARVAAGAAVGWLLAMVSLLFFDSVPPWEVAGVLLAAVVVLSALATLPVKAFRREPAAPARTRNGRPLQPVVGPAPTPPAEPLRVPPSPGEHAAIWPGVGTASPPRHRADPAPPPARADSAPRADSAAPRLLAVPVDGGEWWEAASADGGEAPTPDGSPVLVQCPRCGDFAVDVGRPGRGFTFACDACGYRWQWEPGSPWPDTLVRPHLRDRRAAARDFRSTRDSRPS